MDMIPAIRFLRISETNCFPASLIPAQQTWLTVSFSEIIEQPKNASALGLNQLGRVFEIF